jgi:hypothetical protein
VTDISYYRQLLDAVRRAGRVPEEAYMARTRLRRALVALDRGHYRDSARVESGPLRDAPPEIKQLAGALAHQAVTLCQPSEALDVRWRRDWSSVLDGIDQLDRWLVAAYLG